MMENQAKTRIVWIDTAKAYGIFLVFYGHFVELVWMAGNQGFLDQWKLIYSFHMPLFFILSGYLAKKVSSNLIDAVKKQFLIRLIPLFLFGLMTLPLWVAQDILRSGGLSLGLAKQIFAYLYGLPKLNWPTWFLVCLLTVELINFLVLPHLKSRKHLIAGILIFYTMGWLVSAQLSDMISSWGLPRNFWFFPEALVAYAFYLVGYYLKTLGSETTGSRGRLLNYLVLGISIGVTLVTFDLNQGPFLKGLPGVLMAESWHGNILLFPITALSGSFLIFSLAKLTPKHPWIEYVGRNTLILLGLNGLFVHFFNGLILQFITIPQSWIGTQLFCICITLLSILVCFPFISGLNHVISQMHRIFYPANKDDSNQASNPNIDSPLPIQVGDDL